MFFLHILFSLVQIRSHTKNQLLNLTGIAQKVCVGGGGGWVLKVTLVLRFGPNQAEQKRTIWAK